MTTVRHSFPADMDVFTPDAHGDEARLHRDFAWLRRNMPLAWVDREPYRPFWTVVRNDDIKLIEKNHEVFVSAPRLTLLPKEVEQATLRMFGSRTGGSRTILDMDEPDHSKYRDVSARWFIGSGLRRLTLRVEAIADSFVEKMKDMDGECDFAADIAVWYPLQVIASILGVPPEDAPYILRMTQALLAAGDPELQKDGDYGLRAHDEFMEYLGRMIAERRARPTEDLTSAIANAAIDGEPMGMVEALSYVMVAITAGHDTTSAALAGGMHAFITHPGEMAKLVRQPDLVRNASNEICRWVSPVRHFMRTALRDLAIRDVTIRAGDAVALLFPSGNRDEAVFENADVFLVDRDTSGHVAFGYGVHACVGRQLALLELDAFFGRLSARLDYAELAGPPRAIASNLVGGYRQLPISYRFH